MRSPTEHTLGGIDGTGIADVEVDDDEAATTGDGDVMVDRIESEVVVVRALLLIDALPAATRAPMLAPRPLAETAAGIARAGC